MSMDDKKVSVVTGAAGGIGLACARRLAARGHIVAMADIGGDTLDAAVRLLQDEGYDVMALAGDVGDYGLVQQHGEIVYRKYGRLDVLVNNAGISQPMGLLDITEAEWDK